MTRLRIFGVALLAILIVFSTAAIAGEHYGDKGAKKLLKTSTNDDKAFYLINNIFNEYQNNGNASYNTFTLGSGLEWPKGSGNTAIFEEGLVWSGYHDSVRVVKDAARLKTGGSAYRQGLQAGRITNSGLPYTSLVATDPGDPANRTYRVRPDIGPSQTFADVQKILEAQEVPLIDRYASTSARALYDAYIDDWNNWPASQGAPFNDKNGNGTYEPAIDIPGVPGADQTLWHVMNDLDANRTTYMYGANPIGLEYQRTIWGYQRTGALGNTVFMRNKIINKSDLPLDSAFFAQWSDPDLGDAGDDFVACDIPRSLGYVYNGRARDSYYGDKPPAAGYDFFQGPIVAALGDSGIFNNERRYDVKNLGMSAFNFFINSSATYTDPTQGNFSGTGHWYNLMNGKVAPTGAQNIDLTTGLPTKFMFSGDPTTGKGWIEGTAIGSLAPPGDRRLCSVTGPFTLMPGDTQEVVVACIIARGGDRISSISVLKFYSDMAQSAFDNFFNLPAPPASPIVSVAQLDGEIVLDWSNIAQSTALEAYNTLGYTFQGYNVYQASTPAGENAKLLATYDIVDGVGKIFDNEYDEASGVVLFKPIQFGNDNDIFRFYDTKMDNLTSRSLINGQSYYFSVTAYGYNELSVPKSLESAPQWNLCVPQKPVPGVRYSGAYGDTVRSVHHGSSDGMVAIIVIDPTKSTGHDYVVVFDSLAPDGSFYWSFKDVTAGTTILKEQTNQSGDNHYPVVDGMMIKVAGPAAGINLNIPGPYDVYPGHMGYSVDIAANRWVTWGINWGLETMGGSFGNGFSFFGSDISPANYVNTELRFAGIDNWSTVTDSSSANLMAISKSQHPDRWSKAAVYVRPSYAVGATLADVPFQAWDIENNRQLKIAITEESRPQFGNNNFIWDMGWTGHAWTLVGTTNYGGREYIFILNDTYDEQYTDYLNGTLDGTYNNVMFAGGWTPRFNRPFVAPFKLTFYTSKVNTPADTFAITAPAVTSSSEVAKVDIEKINVFPNPYFGLNLAETSKYERYITFSHLPKNATIRIFTLAGVLVRTLVKPADDTQQFLRWNLNNEAGIPVAAGMFIAYIDMPDLGKTKILKFAVIPESQILDKL